MDFDGDQESITPNQQQYIKINTPGALWLPSGTTAQRPSSPSAGFFRYNTDTPGIEYWNGTTWTAPTGGAGGPSSFTATASEALSSGQFVNFWNNSGTPSIRKADASLGYEAIGYVLAAYSTSDTVTVYTEGENTGLSALSIGPLWLSTGGSVTTSVPTTGNLVQKLGFAKSSTVIEFIPGVPVQT